MVIRKIEEFSEFTDRNKQSVWIFKILKPYKRKTSFTGKKFVGRWLKIDEDGTVTIARGYAWNGCSPKWSFFDLFVFGTPDGIVNIRTCKPKMYYATLVHDAMYQYYRWHHIERKEIDLLFLKMARESKFRLSLLYYLVVRLLGGVFIGKKHPKIMEIEYLL